MAMIVSRGGNFLLNVGPTGKGEIIDYEQEILEEIGDWLMVYGDAIYETEPTPFLRNAEILCTRKPGKLFVFLGPKAAGLQMLLNVYGDTLCAQVTATAMAQSGHQVNWYVTAPGAWTALEQGAADRKG